MKKIVIYFLFSPLFITAFYGGNIELRSGIDPIVWTSRGEIDLVACGSDDSGMNPIIQLCDKFPKFNALYHVPWIIGLELGYLLYEQIEYSIECNYLRAAPRSPIRYSVLGLDSEQLVIAPSSYQLIDTYIGSRYYFNPLCRDHVVFYLGGKIGITHHFSTDATICMNGTRLTLLPVTCDTCSAAVPIKTIMEKNDTVSGGIIFGIDIYWGSRWSFFMQSEIVASGGPKMNNTALFQEPTPAPLSATNMIIGSINTEVRFPILLGFKCTF